jgi:DNA polymerase-3 subunit gamma/tau
VILEAEGIAVEPVALQLLARAGDGSLRDALSLLDQLLAFAGGKVTEESARAMLGTVDRQQVVTLARLVASRDGAGLMRYAQELQQWSADPAQLLDALASLFTQVALRQVVPGGPPIDEETDPEVLDELAAAVPAEDLQVLYQVALLGRRDLALHSDPSTGFAMTLLRMLAFQPGGGSAAVTPPGRPAAQTRAVPAATASLTPPPPQSVAADVTLTRENWAEVVAGLDLGGAARQLAANCAFLRRDGNVVHLALDPRSRTLASKALEDKLAQALGRVTGAQLRLQIDLVEAASDTPARAQVKQADAQLQGARERLAEDPAVKALQERFGARMLDDSVRLTRPDES